MLTYWVCICGRFVIQRFSFLSGKSLSKQRLGNLCACGSPQFGSVYEYPSLDHFRSTRSLAATNNLQSQDKARIGPTQLVCIHDAELALPRSDTKTCQTYRNGRWGSREISPFTRPLLGVRMRSEGDRSARIDTDFAVMPRGTKVVSAESCGISAWTKTAKVCVVLPDGSRKRYFLKVNQP